MKIIHVRDTMKFLRDAGQMNSKMLHALLHAHEWLGLDGKIYKVMNAQPANQLRDEP